MSALMWLNMVLCEGSDWQYIGGEEGMSRRAARGLRAAVSYTPTGV